VSVVLIARKIPAIMEEDVPMRAAVAAGVADVCCVAVFVVIGRANHHDGEGLAGVAGTAWPFLAGLAAGWLVTRGWRRPAVVVPTGVGAWLLCAGAGQLLRVVSGQGTKPAFVAVSVIFLGLFLLGWRLVAAGITRREPSRGPRLSGGRTASPAPRTRGGPRGR
jgi:hypothetical protein